MRKDIEGCKVRKDVWLSSWSYHTKMLFFKYVLRGGGGGEDVEGVEGDLKKESEVDSGKRLRMQALPNLIKDK